MTLDLPPRDEDGHVVPHDHPGIHPDDGVIRRIAEHQLVYDEKLGKKRPSTIAFQQSTEKNGGMSVDLQRLIEEAGVDARTFVASPPWIGAVRFSAETLRQKGLLVGFDPQLPDNPYHGEVWGNFKKSLQRQLVSLAEPFVPWPDGSNHTTG
ncbi:hypothetical protein [Methylosinus sp. PW1]|uniref:hypothetical protein n=1 Tax=Methylosinus sp. PW1 TaxID=107636 RepID=UPI0012EB488F|nr:hypothetical protein [Methylosinus sp. PW1]